LRPSPSPADPAARWTGAHDGQAFFAYSTNYLIDVENAIIVDVEPTTAIRQAEVIGAKRMIKRTAKSFALHPFRLLGDSVSFGPLIAVCCQAYISELAHGTVVVLAPSELVRVAETARARLIVPCRPGALDRRDC
jgi:hypothetical protein